MVNDFTDTRDDSRPDDDGVSGPRPDEETTEATERLASENASAKSAEGASSDAGEAAAGTSAHAGTESAPAESTPADVPSAESAPTESAAAEPPPEDAAPVDGATAEPASTGPTPDATSTEAVTSGDRATSDGEAASGGDGKAAAASAAGAVDEAGKASGAEAADDDKSADAAAKPKPRTSRAAAAVYRAYRAGRVLDGRVEQVIKGGYEIKIAKVRGFCPHSQMDVKRVEEPESFVGKTLPFKITQVRRGGADVVVSRRAVLEESRRDEAKAVRATLIEGAVMLGHVKGLADFGAFVDLGAGVQGLVHVSEVSHNRVRHPSEVLEDGQGVRVKILKLDEKSGRISLSIRQAEADPWTDVSKRFTVGESYKGVVRRLTAFGAFVELAEGVEALAPVGEFPPNRLGWKEGLEVGQEAEWQVLSVDEKARRIALTPTLEGVESLPPLEPGQVLTGKVQRIERYGVFVWLGPGKVGLMPNALTGTPPGTDLSRRFPIADELEVEVVELEDDGRRIRLAAKGARVRAERQRPQRARFDEGPIPDRRGRRSGGGQRERPAAPVSSDAGFGQNLADKLRAALESAGK